MYISKPVELKKEQKLLDIVDLFCPVLVLLLEVPYNFFQEDYTKITPLVDIISKLQGTGDREIIRRHHT